MGGLAIATLAGDNIHGLAPGWLAPTVRAVTVVTWVAATLVDTAADLLRPTAHQTAARPAAIRRRVVGVGVPAWHVLRGQLPPPRPRLGQPSLSTVSLVFFWVALAVWRIVVVAGLLRLRARSCSPASTTCAG